MKHKHLNKLWIIVSAIMLSLMYGCSEDNNHSSDNNELPSGNIRVSPYILKSNNVRMTGSAFEKGDAIGVFAIADVDNNGQNTIDNSYAYNIENIYDGFDWQVASGQSLPWYLGETKVSLYAYYPYQDFTSNDYLHALPFSVKTDQSQVQDFGSSDFLWSKTQPTAPTSEKVGLSFSHSLSKIRVNLKTNNDFPAETVQNAVINIINTLNDATIDLGTGIATVVNNENEASIKALQLATPDEGYDVTFEAIVVPQNIDQNRELISIRSTPDATPINMKPQSSITLKPQIQYTFSYTIDRTSVSVIAEEIQDWNSGGTYDGQINTPVYNAVDISKIDWNTSRVYKIYSNENLVGEVAKEYLYKDGTIERQAIVVYPISASTGKADLTKGFVAQVMEATSSNNNDYNTDTTNNIHGGSISWDITNNTINNYTQGKEAPINRVVIDGNNVFAARPQDLEALTSKVELVTDADKNNYGIVKIATQYWMRENLRTEHYRDGSPIDTYYYDDDINYKNIFGALYAWETITDPSLLTPINTHIATYDDFIALDTYLGDSPQGAGRKLKSPLYWEDPSQANDITGFSALPGGYRSDHYLDIYNKTVWWTSRENGADKMYVVYLNSTEKIFLEYYSKTWRLAIRAVLD